MYYVYIATNPRNTVFYTGITNNISRRLFEHASQSQESFTKRYNVNKLVYYQEFENPKDAIAAEKRIKGWIRQKKIDLVKSINPLFRDLLT